MGQIVIHKKSGTGTINLFGSSNVIGVSKAEQHSVLIGEDTVKIALECVKELDIEMGDYVVAYGSHYVLNQLPKIEKISSKHFTYDMTFEGGQYDLLRAQYMNTDVSGFNTTADFPLTGDLKMFVDLIIDNAVRVFGSGSWQLGDYPTGTETKTLTFSSQNCLAVLQKICQEFDQEFFITQDGNGNKTLNIGKVGTTLTHTYEYGKGKGLYNLTRETVTDKQVVTRLYAFGSTENLKPGYRNYSPRLRMGVTNGKSYIEDASAVAAFGIIEATKIFEDIKPEREGTVTGIVVGDPLSFIDTGMDFDLNEKDGSGNTKYLIPGTTAKIHFNTGGLAGYEFEVSAYDHGTKKFTLIASKDEKGQQFPSADTAAFQIAAGDKYIIVDISMPDSYVTAAETKLQTKAQQYLDVNKAPHVQYSLQVGELYLRKQYPGSIPTNVFNLGDFIPIKDTDLNVDKDIRIIEFTRDLLHPYRYTVNIADTYDITIIQQLIEDNVRINNIIRINELHNVSRVKNTWRTTQELLNMVFDQDNYFDDENIRPGSIETQMLAVGARSQQLSLNNIVIEPNYLGNDDVVAVTSNSGTLDAFTIEKDEVKTWQIGSGTTTLTDSGAYYIYAKCAKADLNDGTIVFDQAERKLDSDNNYYYFLLGVLHSPENGVRWISLTYGTTTINGRFIKTGVIQSADGLNYFDLDGSQFNLGNNTSGLDWDVTRDDTLTIRGAIVQNRGGQSDTLGVFRGDWQAGATYYKGDSTYHNGSTWKWISDQDGNIEPGTDATKWKKIASRGKNAPRIIYKTNTDLYDAPPIDRDNPDIQGWTLFLPGSDWAKILAGSDGKVIVTDEGIEIITGEALEYVWACTEVLDANGKFVEWKIPTRITGRPGDKGDYVEFRYKKNGSTTVAPPLSDADKTNPEPEGWTIEKPAISAAEYIWYISCTKQGNGTMITPWSNPEPTRGVPGDPGPWMNYLGLYDPDKEYHGGSDYINSVYYNGYYYIARSDAGDFTGVLPTDKSKWNPFGAQFESIATGLLLARTAYIDKLIVDTLSTSADNSKPRVTAKDAEIDVYDANETLHPMIRMGKGAGIMSSAPDGKPGIALRDTEDDSSYTENSSEGIFSNGSNVGFLPGSTGLKSNGSLIGLLFKKNDDPNGISAAVVGLDNSGNGNSESWGGYFSSLKVTGEVQLNGLSVSIKSITEDYNVTAKDYWLTCYNTSAVLNVYLPTPEHTKTIIVTRINNGGVAIHGNIFNPNEGQVSSIPIDNPGRTYMFGWDKSHWICAPFSL